MPTFERSFLAFLTLGCVAASVKAANSPSYEITQVIDSTGAGGINNLELPGDLVVDSRGNLFVSGLGSVFKRTTAGIVTEVMDSLGDEMGNVWTGSGKLAVDSLDNLFIGASISDNVFRVSPNGAITQIIDANANGVGDGLNQVGGIAIDANGDAFVSGVISDNILQLSLGNVVEIMNRQDGLETPTHVRSDPHGNIFFMGRGLIRRVNSSGYVENVIDTLNDIPGLNGASDFAVDRNGTIYIAGGSSSMVAKASVDGTIKTILDSEGDGQGNIMHVADRIVVDADGNAFVAGFSSDNVFMIASDETIVEIIDATGDKQGNVLDGPYGLAVDNAGNVFVAGLTSANVFKLSPKYDVEGPSGGNPNSETDNFETGDADSDADLSESPVITSPADTNTDPLPEIKSEESTASCGGGIVPMAGCLVVALIGTSRRHRARMKSI